MVWLRFQLMPQGSELDPKSTPRVLSLLWLCRCSMPQCPVPLFLWLQLPLHIWRWSWEQEFSKGPGEWEWDGPGVGMGWQQLWYLVSAVQPGEQETFSTATKTWQDVEESNPGCSQWCPVLGTGALLKKLKFRRLHSHLKKKEEF